MLESEELKETLNEMSMDDLSAIQTQIRDAKRKRYRSKGKLIHGYVGEKYTNAIPVVIDYLYDQKVLERKTIYNLVRVSVELVIEDVLQKIKNNRDVTSTP